MVYPTLWRRRLRWLGSAVAMQAAAAACILALGLGLALMPFGCAETERASPTPPPLTFTGPRFLHGTVGSLCTLRGFHMQPVSGWGVVVNLRGTGSPDCPAFLKEWLLSEMRKKGLGSPNLGTTAMSPERMLADPNKAVVRVDGLIPPGAIRGTRFDVLVTALPQTQTTSLESGQLWSTDLGFDGANPALRFSTPLAVAMGPAYLSPFDDQATTNERLQLQRRAVVLSGAAVKANRVQQLLLNQASWQRSRAVADRINERFPKSPDPKVDRSDTAVAVSDTTIELNVPRRFAGNPARLMALISHLYLQRSESFEPAQAKTLGELLVADARLARDVTLCWETLGKTALSVIRSYYEHPTMAVKLAALEAGARLVDEAASDPLVTVAAHRDPAVRARAARILACLPRSIRGADTLHRLLDDPDRYVRIAAYQSLSAMGDPVIDRGVVGGLQNAKFILDLVPSEHPMIYINQTEFPRLVVFNPYATFKTPLLAKLWDNRLMLRGPGPDKDISVFCQKRDADAEVVQIKPTVAHLAFLLGHQTTTEFPQPGLDLSYSEVASALYGLHKAGHIDAELELQTNPLADTIARINAVGGLRERPEESRLTGPATQPAGGGAPVGDAPATAPASPGADDARVVPDAAIGPLPIPVP